jgi:V/A-type H+-transporting ATPase subunit I
MLGALPLGIYSKLEDVQPLMVIALAIAAVHMVLGLTIGVRNVRAAHGATLAIQEKGAFIGFLLGGAVAYAGSTFRDSAGITQTGWILVGAGLGLAVASIVLLWMGAAKVYGMGFVGPMELISLGGNFVSYTRLAAIGAAEAGLGLAVYTICFHTLPGGAVGWVLYTICFALLTLLSILSGGLQSLRLQFVEFFGKFFTGGGRPYVPFGRRAAP